jgi:hypothetical protein
LDVTILANNGGPWSTANGTLFIKTLKPAERWEVTADVRNYHVTAHGEDPPPFAGNDYDFSNYVDVNDCEPVEIEY